MKVIATDTSDAKDTIAVTITVNDLEEPGKVSLSWTRPQVGTALEATLTDPDGSISGTTWQWSRSLTTGGTYAAIEDATSGATSATYTPVAGDGEPNYLKATASYTDGEDSGKTAQAVSATPVRAVPTGNEPPVFDPNTGGGYTCNDNEADVCLHVRRSAPAGSDIYYPANATDPNRDELRYSLGGSDKGLFSIDPSRGTLFTTKAHAYDDPGADGKFEITITATDPSGADDSITVAIEPSGGQGPPVVKGPERIVYPENGTWPLATYSATASNSDGDIRDIHGWIIAVQPGGGDGDFFDIDDDGNLTFTQPPDYEDPADDNGDNTYSFSLHVYDTNPPNREGRPDFLQRECHRRRRG